MTTILAYGTNQYLYALLLDPVAHETGWSRAALAAGFSGVVLVSGFAGVVAGPLVDRYGARVPLAAGSLVNGVVLLLLARTTSLAAWDALWTIGIGVGSALTYYPVTMTVVANWFARERSRALGALTLMGAFSSTFTYPLAGLLIARLGWREALVVLAFTHLALALPLHASIVRRRPEDRGLAPDGLPLAPSAEIAMDGLTLREALRTPAFWLLAAAFALAYFASTAILLQHVSYLIARGYAPTAAAALVGLIGIAYIPGRIAVAFAGTAHSPRHRARGGLRARSGGDRRARIPAVDRRRPRRTSSPSARRTVRCRPCAARSSRISSAGVRTAQSSAPKASRSRSPRPPRRSSRRTSPRVPATPRHSSSASRRCSPPRSRSFHCGARPAA